MTEEGTFHLSLQRQAIQYMSINEEPDSECELSGKLGRVAEVNVFEDFLLEIKGTTGILRLSLSGDHVRKLFSAVQKADNNPLEKSNNRTGGNK